MLVDSLQIQEASPIYGLGKSKTINQPGMLVPIVGVTRWSTTNHIRIGSLQASVSIAPTGRSIAANLKKNGSVIANIIIPENETKVTVTTFLGDGNDAKPEDYFTLDVIAVGSVIPGSGLKVQVNYVETED